MAGEGTARASEAAAGSGPGARDDGLYADLLAGEGAGVERASAAQHRLRALVAGAVRRATAAQALDAATLDDLIQVASVHVLGNLERFEGRSKFSTWVYAVAVRAALGELRRATYRRPGQELPRSEAEELESGVRSPPQRAERQEIVELLHRIIEQELTERQRTAILGELAGQSQEELLATLGLNRNALYKLLHDGRRKLKQGLLAAGILDDQVREAFDL